MLALTIGILGSIVSSCGSGVDRSDPRSVAEKAAEYYYSWDYEQLKTLVNPNDTHRLNELDKLTEMAKKAKEMDPDAKPKARTFTFNKMTDTATGGDVTEATTAARVVLDTEEYPVTVFVRLEDGQWYYERIQ